MAFLALGTSAIVLYAIRLLAAFTKDFGELAMHWQTGQQLFLSKAKDAELGAAKARNEGSRASWLRIADCYRDLARFNQF